MIVLIDGENLRHQIAHILKEESKIADKNAYFKFDLIGFLQEVLTQKNLDVTYYTTKIKQPQQKIPLKLQKRIAAIMDANRHWIADITNQQIKVVKAGYLRVRESNACVHCGKKTMVLQEKGVDVRVATDLVLSSRFKKELILVSSDSDLVPAIQASKKGGATINYLCYAGWLNRSVATQTKKTITFDTPIVLKYFKEKQR